MYPIKSRKAKIVKYVATAVATALFAEWLWVFQIDYDRRIDIERQYLPVSYGVTIGESRTGFYELGLYGVVSDHVAFYTPHFNVVKFRKDDEGTVPHELGHVVWHEYLSDENKSTFCDTFDWVGYSRNGSCEEGFAEYFAEGLKGDLR